MSDSIPAGRPRDGGPPAAEVVPATAPNRQLKTPAVHNQLRRETRRWWIKLLVQPVLLAVCGALVIVGLGVAQRCGLIAAGGGQTHQASEVVDARYICPMMCTPPQAEPGRCPVCAMELVAATADRTNTDARAVHIDSASRRIANIQTVAVTSIQTTRTIRAIGELSYDEGSLKTISAYVDGRLERLYADYTGVVVTKGDHLALVYSPRLFSGQVELLLARKSRDESQASTFARVVESNQDLYAAARQRLLELGMTNPQIEQLEEAGVANSRMHLCAPISGTVIHKRAVEGEYVKEGDTIYQLADLSTVWLMLRLFPEDAMTIRYGQKVIAEIQSLRGQEFTGRVAFIDPHVDPKTRTVGVRVVIPNDDGLLRVGDYAKATINVPLADSHQALVYDAELAGKWISPRHPHVIAEMAGDCPISGVELVPTAQFGFADQPGVGREVLAVDRDAVLMAGNNSVLYVETEPGRFEIRRVVLGPGRGDQIVIRSGVKLGEQVATRGNFLIDSQMQLAGNPSLIDPTRLDSMVTPEMSTANIAELVTLSGEDRVLAERQGICPVAELPLGSMGTPQKVDVNGEAVFICCEGCREPLLREPDKYLARLATRQLEASAEESAHDHTPMPPAMDLPPIGVPQMIEPLQADAIQAAPHRGNVLRPAAKRVAELNDEAVR